MFCSSRSGSPVLAIVVLIAAGLLAMPGMARADDAGGISVIGTGQAQTRPSTVEIDATVSGDGELAADAMVKYRDTKKKALAAMDALKIPGLTVESQGQQLTDAIDPNTQMRMMQGMAPDNSSKAKVHVAEGLKLIIKETDSVDSDKLMDTVLKVLDAARDAGLQVGPPPPSNYYEMQVRSQSGETDALAAFVIPDTSALRDDAYQKAMDDAKAKAQHLAQLSGVKLGPVISVADNGLGGNSRAAAIASMEGITPPQGSQPKEAKSSTLHDIQVTVQLSVRFAILPADGK